MNTFFFFLTSSTDNQKICVDKRAQRPQMTLIKVGCCPLKD